MTDLGVWGGTVDLCDDAHNRRLQEQRDSESDPASPNYIPPRPVVERKWAGPYCHRCGSKVDHRRPEGSLGVYETYDRNTNNLHRMRCFDARLRR